MIYDRVDREDYQRWAALLNDSNWSYESILPYFKKSENFTYTRPNSPIDIDFHGYNGPVHTTQIVPAKNVSSNIIEGSVQLGYNEIDYNGKEKQGISVLQFTVKDGLRVSSGSAYINPIKDRANLNILVGSYVTKLEIDYETNAVKGVIFTRNNKTYLVRTKKEVILSAGAVSSPQILLLSGIGPKQHLDSLKIPVVQDLPVGEHLKDHVAATVSFSSNITSSESLEKSVTDFLANRTGTLTRSLSFDPIGFFKTVGEPDNDYLHTECLFTNLTEINRRF